MKKVSTLFFLVLSFHFQIANAQVTPLEWSRCYGGSLSDWGEFMYPLQDGSFLMTGSSESNDNDVSGHHSNGYYVGYDYWVAHAKADGTILWQKSYGGTSTDLGRAIVQPDAAHYVISGYAISNDDDISGNHGYYDLWLLKIDTAGNLLWQKTYGGTDEDDNWDLIETADNGFLLTGATLSIDGDVTNPHGAYDSWVVKTDSLGNLQWQKTFGGTGDEYFNQTIQTDDGNFLSVGRTYSADGDVNYLHGNADLWVVKYDTMGTLLWEKTYGGNKFDEAQGIVKANGSGYVITGTTKSHGGDVNGNHGQSDVWVIAIDETGSLLWQHCYGGSLSETSWGITVVPTGYLISAETYSSDSDVTNNYGGKDGWVISIDNTGNILWQKNYGGSGEDWIRMVKPAPDGSMYAIGTSASSDYDAANAYGDYDFFVLKYEAPCQPVTADFSIQAIGPLFTFSDSSVNATQWFWDFGDGGTSTDQNPIHEFLLSGTYTICLIASDSCSSDTLCRTIKLIVNSTEELLSMESQLIITPNPFFSSATIQFSLTKESRVEISLLDLEGRKIKMIAEGFFESGQHTLNYKNENLDAGSYLMQYKSENQVMTKKVVID